MRSSHAASASWLVSFTGSSLVSLLLLIAMAVPTARAQPEPGAPPPTRAQLAEARSLFERGLTFVDQERWGEALEFFRRSRAIAERPNTVYNMGTALYRLGRAREAAEAFADYLRIATPADEPSQHAEAQRLLTVLRASVPTLALTVSPEDAEVRVDDAVIAGSGSVRVIELDAGEHRVAVSAARHVTQRFTVASLPATRIEREVSLAREAPRPTVLSVTSAVEGAVVRVDGRVVASGRTELRVQPGQHLIEATAEGYRPFSREVIAREGETVRVHAGLDRIPSSGGVLASPWFWIVASVVVVGAGVGVGIAVATGGTDDPLRDYQGTTNVVIQALSF